MKLWQKVMGFGVLIWLTVFVGPWPVLLLLIFAGVVADQYERIQKS